MSGAVAPQAEVGMPSDAADELRGSPYCPLNGWRPPDSLDQIFYTLDIGVVAGKVSPLVEIDAGGEMDRCIGCGASHRFYQAIGIEDVAHDVGGLGRDLVEPHDLAMFGAQPSHQRLADEAGASGH